MVAPVSTAASLLVDIDLGAVGGVDVDLAAGGGIGVGVHVEVGALRLSLNGLGGLDVLLDDLLVGRDDGVGRLDRVLGCGVLHLAADDAFVGHGDSSRAPFGATLVE